MEAIKEYDKTVAVLRDIYIKKNHDYGDSFSESIKEWGVVAALVRMDDKMRRLKQLAKNDAMVNETMRDTLLDMANYAIMTAMNEPTSAFQDYASKFLSTKRD